MWTWIWSSARRKSGRLVEEQMQGRDSVVSDPLSQASGTVGSDHLENKYKL